MGEPLFIRNITSTRLELKTFQHQRPSSSESFEDNDVKDVSVLIEPFQTSKTEIVLSLLDDNVTTKLSLECEGQRYRLSIPTPKDRSTTLTSLDSDPKHEFTAVYLPEKRFLALFSSANLDCWMKHLNDDTPLSSLSIPGTHNSPTHYRAMPSVRCQAVSVREQLGNGVRFFDIRVQPDSSNDMNKKSLHLVHSAFPISLLGAKHFKDLLEDVNGFLEANPSETLIMSLKREGTGSATDAYLSTILKQHYAGDNSKWFTEPRMPSLRETRGKIVLIRRFGLDDSLKGEWDGKGWGIDASVWADNTPCALNPSGDICVQDFYEVLESSNIDKKITYVQEQLARAAAQTSPKDGDASASLQNKCSLHINFLSGSNFWKMDCWPEKIAAKVNPATIDYLCRKHNEPSEGKPIGDGCTGVVVCDWVGNNGDWDLIRCIVAMNSRLIVNQDS